jgi:hypothetical protein
MTEVSLNTGFVLSLLQLNTVSIDTLREVDLL